MSFSDLIYARHSIRNYTTAPVDSAKVDRIVEAANRAPSAANLQAYEIYLVANVKDRSALSRACCEQGFVLVAPVSLVFCANTARNKDRFGERASFYAIQDATIACTYAQLAAADLGLGTCWVGAFNADAVRKVIGAPPGHEPVAVLPVGHPKGQAEVKDRRPLADILHDVG